MIVPGADMVDSVGPGESTDMADVAVATTNQSLSLAPVGGKSFPTIRVSPTTRSRHRFMTSRKVETLFQFNTHVHAVVTDEDPETGAFTWRCSCGDDNSGLRSFMDPVADADAHIKRVGGKRLDIHAIFDRETV
jgi:hypothetical protein